jgi:glycosyltransferase involved in cell wall biosynthesis
VTRADSDKRLALLERTVKQARKKAGHEFFWQLIGSGVQPPKLDGIDDVISFDNNVGQHFAWNLAYDHALHDFNSDYFLRIDDDCEFLSQRWLAKLVDASVILDDKMILAPIVRGLVHPPDRSEVVEVKGQRLSFLMAAIGGVCRLHPTALLKKHNYISDVRLALGAGDATGIARWCREHIIPMAYVMSIRVRHSTQKQMDDDPDYFKNHALYQRLPYIPTWSHPCDPLPPTP